MTNESRLVSIDELDGLIPATSCLPMVVQWTELPLRQVEQTVLLLDEGATVPFISRYRKEMTGGLDEVQVQSIRDSLHSVREFLERRKFICESVAEQGKLTPGLLELILEAKTRTEIEDLYLPYRRRRLTRADKARSRGLEPLARVLQGLDAPGCATLLEEAGKYLNPDSGVDNEEDALAGARDICAEVVSEHVALREALRNIMRRTGMLTSSVIRGKEEQGAAFRDYHDYREPVFKVPSHRLLAVARGENEQLLRVHIEMDEAAVQSCMIRHFPQLKTEYEVHWVRIRSDAWSRLLHPSLESEVRREMKEKADLEAIRIFVGNLRELLMSPPVGVKRVMALDPGFRTGCKVAILNAQGTFLAHRTIYPHPPREEKELARKLVLRMVNEYQVEAIAVGSGTAGRETEAFLREIVRDGELSADIPIVRVDESGASIYSASPVAREEFPDLDLTVRGAISIGRRLQDPLGELVRIEPRSLGVGQYQHDVDQARLKQALDDVVESCVNQVGVELNTASFSLLQYVSGVGEKLARGIVAFRDQNGPFRSRRELLKVPRLGPKAFEQCAGFVRISNGLHPLDASAVHPERYGIVERMAVDQGIQLSELVGNPKAVEAISPDKYCSDDVGLYTLRDILAELRKPGRDPRKQFEVAGFSDDVNSFEDLEEGMILPGIVTNVTAFGAFVDVGVHQDGLVHVSELSHTFVKDPMTVVRPGMKVTVKVIGLDTVRRRIALSIKACLEPPAGKVAGSGTGSRRSPGDRSSDPSNPFQKFFRDKR